MKTICEKTGLLNFDAAPPSPANLIGESFECDIFGETVTVDHLVVSLADADELRRYGEALESLGSVVVEGPGLWPYDFCADAVRVPRDLAMHFASFARPTDGVIVLSAPQAAGDQLNRFRRTRGAAAIHHLALRVEDVAAAAGSWARRGFAYLSPLLDDGQLQQQFLRNQAGQIIEMIQRRAGGSATFSCGNIAGLRRAEVNR
jgi:hypothetical protein